jgi:hypothetical protein
MSQLPWESCFRIFCRFNLINQPFEFNLPLCFNAFNIVQHQNINFELNFHRFHKIFIISVYWTRPTSAMVSTQLTQIFRFDASTWWWAKKKNRRTRNYNNEQQVSNWLHKNTEKLAGQRENLVWVSKTSLIFFTRLSLYEWCKHCLLWNQLWRRDCVQTRSSFDGVFIQPHGQTLWESENICTVAY